jgi:hypothetical protein
MPFIAAAYVIAVCMPLVLSVEALFRVRSAQRQLQAIDACRARGRA